MVEKNVQGKTEIVDDSISQKSVQLSHNNEIGILGLKLRIFLLDFFDLLSFLIFVTGVVLFIRFFVFNPYSVVGKSMEPFFSEGDFIIVDKITPKIGKLERGDIIVFVAKGKELPFIKRVIGLPGETVKIREGKVYICDNDKTEIEACIELNEWYLPLQTITSTDMCRRDTFEVDEVGYFVLGDNRNHSTDSRCCFGLSCYENANYLVYDEDMIGKVALKIYPEMHPYW